MAERSFMWIEWISHFKHWSIKKTRSVDASKSRYSLIYLFQWKTSCLFAYCYQFFSFLIQFSFLNHLKSCHLKNVVDSNKLSFLCIAMHCIRSKTIYSLTVAYLPAAKCKKNETQENLATLNNVKIYLKSQCFTNISGMYQ